MSIKIVGIDGAARSESKTRQLLHMVGERIVQQGATFTVYTQEKSPLPIFDDRSESIKNASVQELFRVARDADAFVLSSPEYHGGMSGVLKNTLDWITHEAGGVDLSGRVFGLVGGGGGLANSGATMQMMMTVRSMHGWLMPDVTVSVSNIWDALQEGVLVPQDQELNKRIGSFAEKLVLYAKEFRMMRERLAA